MPRIRPLHLLLAALGAAALTAVAGAEEPAAGPLQFEKSEHDFGICEQQKEYTAEIAYRNTGKGHVLGIRAKSDCGCYTVALSHRSLEPGGIGKLSVRFRTLTFIGKFSKSLRLFYMDGDQGREIKLRFKLSIFGGVLVREGRLHFGEVLAGTRPGRSVAIVYYEGVGRPFEIKSVDVGDLPISADVHPWVDMQQPRWNGWRVHFEFTKPPPRGVFSKRAIIHTTSKKTPRVTVPLTAHVVGKVWVQTTRVNLGLVPEGATRSAWVNFKPFSKDIQLGRVSARSRKGVLQTKIEETMGSRGPTRRLRVIIPPDAPIGSLDDVVELRTEVPGEEITEIEVRGRIFRRTGD